jgi:hypothetical protein
MRGACRLLLLVASKATARSGQRTPSLYHDLILQTCELSVESAHSVAVSQSDAS